MPKSPFRVVLVDDNPDDRMLVVRELKRQFEDVQVEQIPAAAEWERALNEGAYDLLITDFDLRWSNGLVIFSQARRRWPDMPVVMFTGTGSEEIAVEAMKAGLDDYVIKKQEHFRRLSSSVKLVMEKREHQRALRATAEELRIRNLAVESSIAGICFADMQGAITSANPAFRRMVDPTEAADLRGLSVRNISARPERFDKIIAHIHEHGSWQGEGTLVRFSGESLPVLITASVFRTGGTPAGIVATVIDISEQKRAEAEANENAARLTMAVEAGNVGLWDWDLTTGKSVFSLAWKRQLGFEEHELPDNIDAWRERIHPDDRPAWEKRLERFLADPDAYRLQIRFRMRHKDGGVLWILSNAMVTRDAEGRAVRLRGSHLDITDLMMTEEAVRHERDFSKAVLSGMPAMLFCHDENFKPLRWNSMVEKVTGHTGAELAKMHPLSFVAPDHLERTRALLQEVFDQGEVSLEADVIDRAGRRIPYFFSAFLSMIGGRRCLIGIGLDISERKRAEAQMRELTVRLIRAQDEERRRIARELHDATAQNLATLNMNLALLEQSLTGEDSRSARMVIECQDLTDLCAREIRTVSYLLHPPLLDEFGLARACREYCRGLAKRSGLEIDLDVSETLPRLSDDAELALFRVLQEALINVYRHSGSPVAQVRLREENGAVRLEIRDEGRGLVKADARSGSDAALPGVGIAGMAERMHAFGGNLEVSEGLPGVVVRATLPLEGNCR